MSRRLTCGCASFIDCNHGPAENIVRVPNFTFRRNRPGQEQVGINLHNRETHVTREVGNGEGGLSQDELEELEYEHQQQLSQEKEDERARFLEENLPREVTDDEINQGGWRQGEVHHQRQLDPLPLEVQIHEDDNQFNLDEQVTTI